jgi:hypothetical protein
MGQPNPERPREQAVEASPTPPCEHYVIMLELGECSARQDSEFGQQGLVSAPPTLALNTPSHDPLGTRIALSSGVVPIAASDTSS